MTIKKSALLFGLLSVLTALPTYAQFARVELAVGYRRSVMFVHDRHLRMLEQAVKGERPYNAQEVANSAAVVQRTVSAGPWLPWLLTTQPVVATGDERHTKRLARTKHGPNLCFSLTSMEASARLNAKSSRLFTG